MTESAPSTGSGTGATGSGTGTGGPAMPEVFPPTLREVMVRPRWLAMLALCLVVAGVFAWLGQWQLGRAVQTNPTEPGATEQVQPLADVVAPGEYLPEPLVGQQVSVSGSWIPGDFLLVESRLNDGVEGYWVTGQLRLTGTEAPTSLAVAIGWAQTPDAAASSFSAAAAAASAVCAHPIATASEVGASVPVSRSWPVTQ